MMNSNQTQNITPYQDINDILTMLSKYLKDILDNQLVGVYLTGSLTYGDFDRGSSDIDFLVVSRSSLSDRQREQVKNLHNQIAEKYPLWAKRIECSYITEDMLENIEPPINSRPYINGGQMWNPDPPYGNEWMLNLYVLYESGIALVGPDPKILINHPINIELVREASRKDFHQEWEPLLKDSSSLQDSHFQAYVILTLCRILHRAKNDKVASKKVASAWVKKLYSKTWHHLIEAAENWQHGQEMNKIEETLNFIRFISTEIN